MIENIQVLRFFAALWVVLFHTLVPLVVPQAWQPELPAWLEGLCRMGFAGVDLFFVISGAVIAESTRGMTPGASASRRFVAVRLARIYLGWWPFFALYLAAFAWWGWPLAEKRLTASFLLLPVADVVKYLLVLLWTLSMEIYFYLVVGALLLLPRGKLRLGLALWAGIVLVAVVINLATGRYATAHTAGLGIFRLYLASPFVLEFIAGFLLCELVRARPGMPLLPWTLSAGALAAAAAWVHFRGGLGFFGLADFTHAPLRVALFGGMSAALVTCALLVRQTSGTVGLALARLGDASYALYLCHILVLTSMYLLLSAWAPTATMRLGTWWLALALVVAWAACHYRWIEKPLYRGARRRLEQALA